MKNLLTMPSNLAKTLLVTSFVAIGCTAIGGTAEASPAPADSASAHGSASYPVGYADLDVSSPSGAKTLYLRIRYAAEVVCESAASWGKKEGLSCVNKAVNDAVTRINRPLLSKYLQQRTEEKSGQLRLANAE